MKSLTELWSELATEVASWCGVCADRDIKTLRSRVDHEGESFLTITLPTYASDLERALDVGEIAPDSFLGFKRRAGLPAFLSGFLELVFDRRTRLLLDDPSVDAIFAMRQLTLLFKKLEGECTEPRKRMALESFIDCERDLKSLEGRLDANELSELARIFAIVFGDSIDQVNLEIETGQIAPEHGPGATADKKFGNQKFVQTEWPVRLDRVFPYCDNVPSRWGLYNPDDPGVKFLEPGAERPVKVTLVPKTRKTPRVIAIEPTAMQYMQQGIMRSLVPKLESDSLGFVGFTDQSRNRDMARKGSIDGSFATLDLSEASDRVLNSIVLRLVKPWPSFSEALQATRSRTAELPDGRRVRLSKFASMGSALCFPVEALVFTTIVLKGIQDTAAKRLTRREIYRLAGSVRVFGDDIIVPGVYAEGVASALEAYGLKVNHRKSFWTGRFRESCGGDFFDGQDVTPVYLRRRFPTSPRNAQESVSTVSTANQLHARGLWRTASFVAGKLERVLGTLPIVAPTSPALGLHSYCGIQSQKMDPDLHRPLVKAFVVDAAIPANGIDGVWALRKTLTGDFTDPLHKDHLNKSGRPVSVRIKRRWVPAA